MVTAASPHVGVRFVAGSVGHLRLVSVADDHADLICSRVEHRLVPPLDATQDECATCNQPVWLTPSDRTVLARGARPLCVPCLWERMRA